MAGLTKRRRPEPVRCWGCHGRAPKPSHLGSVGWHARRVSLDGTRSQVEVYCPTCHAEHGWPELNTEDGAMGKQVQRPPRLADKRAAATAESDTAGWPRLTDDHVVTECGDCERVLLSQRHAAEAAKNPGGLPPVVAGTIRLRGGRVLSFCATCFEPKVRRVSGAYAGGAS